MRMGHATLSTTLDIYSHVVPGLQEQAARTFAAAMEAAKKDRLSANVGRMSASPIGQNAATCFIPISGQNSAPNQGEHPQLGALLSSGGTPGRTRTADKRFRKPLLYPPELQGHSPVPGLEP